jgi:hypothetical protein
MVQAMRRRSADPSAAWVPSPPVPLLPYVCHGAWEVFCRTALRLKCSVMSRDVPRCRIMSFFSPYIRKPPVSSTFRLVFALFVSLC